MWLGHDADHSRLAASAIHQNTATKYHESSWTPVILYDDSYVALHNASSKFLSNPWFTRAWVVQEFVLGARDNEVFRIDDESFSTIQLVALDSWIVRTLKRCYDLRDARHMGSEGGCDHPPNRLNQMQNA
jgi:hypothetical protein